MGFWSELGQSINIFKGSGPDLSDPATRERTAREWGGGRFARLQEMPKQIEQLKRQKQDIERRIRDLRNELSRVQREKERDIKGRNVRFFERKISDLHREIDKISQYELKEADRAVRKTQSDYYRELKQWNRLPKDVQDAAYGYYKNPSSLAA